MSKNILDLLWEVHSHDANSTAVTLRVNDVEILRTKAGETHYKKALAFNMDRKVAEHIVKLHNATVKVPDYAEAICGPAPVEANEVEISDPRSGS